MAIFGWILLWTITDLQLQLHHKIEEKKNNSSHWSLEDHQLLQITNYVKLTPKLQKIFMGLIFCILHQMKIA
jgi:hypothetical protein